MKVAVVDYGPSCFVEDDAGEAFAHVSFLVTFHQAAPSSTPALPCVRYMNRKCFSCLLGHVMPFAGAHWWLLLWMERPLRRDCQCCWRKRQPALRTLRPRLSVVKGLIVLNSCCMLMAPAIVNFLLVFCSIIIQHLLLFVFSAQPTALFIVCTNQARAGNELLFRHDVAQRGSSMLLNFRVRAVKQRHHVRPVQRQMQSGGQLQTMRTRAQKSSHRE